MTNNAGPERPYGETAAALSSWGWDDFFQEDFERRANAGDAPARVLRSDAGAALVALGAGEAHLPIHRHLLASGEGRPTTGDWVVVSGGEIAAVLARRTALVRASVDPSGAPQVLAANVEFVLVAEPLGERWRPRRLERLLVLAWQSGALPVVVLTKADRSEQLEDELSAAMMTAPGVAVHAVSATEGVGLEELAAELAPGTTAVIIGRSGAGKSTLANALSGGLSALATSEVRGDGKGRHTTVTRELVRLANGALMIDTPGLRAIGLVDSPDAVGEAFSDIEGLALACRFSDCAHESEPGCAVTAAIVRGEMDRERLAGYRRLEREMARLEARRDPRLMAERGAKWRALSRQMRHLPRR